MFLIQDLQHVYQNKIVVHIAQWQAQQGQQWLLLGKSGSGKTTVLQVLAGLLSPTQGRVNIAGQQIDLLSAKKLDIFRATQIGIVFQKPHFISTLTILDNLLLAQYLAGFKKEADVCLKRLEGLNIADKAKNYPNQLSQGELQRVSVARALLNRPSLLLADEPTASLDDENAENILQLFKKQAQQFNTTLLIATHDQRLKSAFDLKYIL
jgi:putative ABC transport system ATP-binding protein